MTEPMPEPTDHLPATRRAALVDMADLVAAWPDDAAVPVGALRSLIRERAESYPDGECQVTMRTEADRVRVEWTGARGPSLISAELVERWAARTNELVDRNEVLRDLRDALREDLRQQQLRQQLAERDVADLKAERALLRTALEQAVDGWSIAAECWPSEPARRCDREKIARIRRTVGLT